DRRAGAIWIGDHGGERRGGGVRARVVGADLLAGRRVKRDHRKVLAEGRERWEVRRVKASRIGGIGVKGSVDGSDRHRRGGGLRCEWRRGQGKRCREHAGDAEENRSLKTGWSRHVVPLWCDPPRP